MNKTGKTLEQIIYEILKGRPFDSVAKENTDLYDA
jgi:hypothetical protein